MKKKSAARRVVRKRSPQQRPPGYELFFAPLQVALDPNDLERVQFAYFCSKYGHAKQKREEGGRYFDHPKGAAWIYVFELGGRDPRVIIGLLLHDMSEDTYLLSPYRLSLNFGVDVALDVGALTKLPRGKETIIQYLRRVIFRGAWTILEKLCDRLHNLRTLGRCSAEKRKKQIAETRRYHLPMLIPALRRCGKPWSGYADILKRLINEAIAQHE